MNKKIWIISGYPAGMGGAGFMLERLILNLKRSGVSVKGIGMRSAGAPTMLLRRGRFVSLIKELFLRFVVLKFRKNPLDKYKATSAATPILFHPQELGYRNAIEFIQRCERVVYLYVLDNSFFCLRSYNVVSGELRPCLDCISGDFSGVARRGCRASRSLMGVDELRAFMGLVQAKKVRLLLQSYSQLSLVKAHFGDDVDATVVGVDLVDYAFKPTVASRGNGYDFVFHGSPAWVKGLSVVVDLARRLPHRSFFCPVSSSAIANICRGLSISEIPRNIEARDIRWDSGLKEEVSSAKVVCCPSLWLGAVEGALLKSIQYNGATLVVDNPTAFSSEIPKDCLLAIDLSDLDSAVIDLDRFIDDTQAMAALRERSQKWLSEQTQFGDGCARNLVKAVFEQS